MFVYGNHHSSCFLLVANKVLNKHIDKRKIMVYHISKDEKHMKILSLKVNTKSKEFMFKLGMIFASGAKISIENIEEVNKEILEEEKSGFAKSFNMMIKYWADNNLNTSLLEIIPDEKKLFLICPVRGATETEKENLNRLITEYENQGFDVHYPERDTNQDPHQNGVNTGGYNICLQNASAIANAKNVSIFYNKTSTGSMFDLGITYYMQTIDSNRKFVLLNKVDFDKENHIDNMICELIERQKLTV